MLLSQHIQQARLVDGNAHRLFNVQVISVFQHVHPDIEHDVRLTDHGDAVRLHFIQHLAIDKHAARPASVLRNMIFVTCILQSLRVNVAYADDLHIVQIRERRIMHQIGSVSCANKGQTKTFHRFSFL